MNNDDLIEIMGNSNEPLKVGPHLSKMFAAITSITLSDVIKSDTLMVVNVNENSNIDNVSMNLDNNSVKASLIMTSPSMTSKEDEIVMFTTPLDLSVGVKDWLIQLELQMQISLESNLALSVVAFSSVIFTTFENTQDITITATNTPKVLTTLMASSLIKWIEQFPAQVTILTIQLQWSQSMELALEDNKRNSNISSVMDIVTQLEEKLRYLSQCVLIDMKLQTRKKCEQLLTEFVYQRDSTRHLNTINILNGKSDFSWQYHMRFYYSSSEKLLSQKLKICMADASFYYGFEYLGIGERLVQTPLTDRCYLTLTQVRNMYFNFSLDIFCTTQKGSIIINITSVC